MKTPLNLGLTMLLIVCVTGSIAQEPSVQEEAHAITRVTSSSDLYPLVEQWVTDFNASSTTLEVQLVQSGTVSLDDKSIHFVSGTDLGQEQRDNAWRMLVGRDVWVPVISSTHPYLDEIYAKGLTTEQLKNMFETSGKMVWGDILGNKSTDPVEIYVLEDQELKLRLADFLNVETATIELQNVVNSEQILKTIQQNSAALGFCRLTEVIDPSDNTLLKGINFLPMDVNGNGRLDQMENYYQSANDFYRAVWLGKYPKSLVCNIYATATKLPGNETERSFLNWVLMHGDKGLQQEGHLGLVNSELPSKLSKLNDYTTTDVPLLAEKNFSTVRIIIILIALTLVFIMLMEIVLRAQKRKKKGVLIQSSGEQTLLNSDLVNMPQGMYFSDSHTWAFMERDGNMRVGVDDFIPHLTGAVTRTQLKGEGASVRKGDPILSIIQHGKKLKLHSPISGQIKAFNSQLITDPSLISSAPYTEGWVYLIQPTNWLREIEFLKPAMKYKNWIDSELKRFKDFLMHSSAAIQAGEVTVALQDGGEVVEHVLSDMGPEIWVDFQTQFLDVKK